ncbi:MAG: hypothetical protein IPN54_16795 [Bacteroidetes bacterium]|nr:hypothetical protein [Bacteroidota bacterium]MBK9425747.1 hypothetical protein [Bacteroidota bacterium]
MIAIAVGYELTFVAFYNPYFGTNRCGIVVAQSSGGMLTEGKVSPQNFAVLNNFY